jgi:hypothetical protein
VSDVHEGGCVCGAVRYRVHGAPLRVTVCHCTWCQRRTGSAFAVSAVFEQARFELTGRAPQIHRHRSDESGRWLDQHFCPDCGGQVGFTLEWVGGVFAVAAGTFDEPRWLDPVSCDFRYVYLRSAQCWSTLPEGVERYERHFRG